MITAEEFLNSKSFMRSDLQCETNYQLMIEFAKLHVKTALENAYDCGTFKGWTNSDDDNEHKELFVRNIMARGVIK